MNAELKSNPTAPKPEPPISAETPSAPTDVITIGKGLTKEFMFDKRIVVYMLDTVNRTVLDEGADDISETLASWPEGHPYLAIYDITSTKVALTPHLRSRLEELSKSFPERAGRSAVVLPRSIITQVFKLFVNALNRKGTRRSKQVFFDRESAIDWLKQVMVDP